jgi:hypothetical protein
MAFSSKILAEGQLPNAKGTLYTVPALTKAYVKFVNAHNTPGGGSEAVKFYIKKSGSVSRRLAHGTLTASEQLRAVDKDETLNLDAGDIIEGETTTAATVDYLVTGVEET